MNTNRKGLTRLQSIGLISAGVVVGGLLVGASAASAATSTTAASAATSGTTAATTAAAATAVAASPSQGGATPVRSDEKSLNASQTATLKAAALKAVPGATVYRVESDAGDGVYEVHLTKSDGSLATVKFDKNLAVTKIESGMGQGDPAPQGAAPGA
jgi:uncharacterized membrane protein YkoI